MSVARSEEAKPSSASPDGDIKADVYEIEVFKSQVVTIASCEFNEDKGNVENIRYKSCGAPAVENVAANSFRENSELKKDSVAASSAVEHKPRRFKRISLPQWLLKPSRKASHNSSRIRRVSGTGKHRIMRINSAPKSFGPSGNNFSHYDDDKFHFFHKNSSKESAQHGNTQPVKETRKMRRISLPAHVLDESGSGVAKRLAEVPMPRTPEPKRKNVAELDAKFIQSLKIKDPPFASGISTKQGTSPEQNTTENNQINAVSQDSEGKSISTRDTREMSTQLKNARKESAFWSNANANSKLSSRPVLKLHKFHNPDIFYVPLPDDDSQSSENLSHKLCRARLIEPRNENYMIQECVKEELQAFLHDKKFCSRSCQQWCLELSQNIKTTVHRMKDCESKIACVVYIGALRGHGVHAAAQCIWTPNDDNFITVNFKNRSMIAVASVLAIKYA